MKTQNEIVELISAYRAGFAEQFAAFDAHVQATPGADVAAKVIAVMRANRYNLDIITPLCKDKGAWADDYSYDFRDGSRALYNYKNGWMHTSSAGVSSRVR